ncbi:MAG: hypothetical protein IPP59_03925 [Betaproteobacteria bacterium]|jgi:hypothetical protein|nr:hypothetical protein [Candidatus Dechloromonas phosphorivorans]
MAETNSTNSEIASNRYISMSADERTGAALEIAEEISEQGERLFCLASALRDNLAANFDEMKGHSGALRLAELLEELMGEKGSQNSLLDCLKAMQPA